MNIDFIIILIIGALLFYEFSYNEKKQVKEKLYKYFLEVNYMNTKEYGKEFLNELLKMQYRNNVMELMTIALLESNLDKYARGDGNYSIGFFQMNTYRGNAGISTVDQALNLYSPILELKDYDIRTNAIEKAQRGEKGSLLFDTYIQFQIANTWINHIKNRLKDKNIAITQKRIAFLYNAGVGNLMKVKNETELDTLVDIWTYRYNYWTKYKGIQDDLIKIWGE